MGGDRVTIRNLKVVAIDVENNLLVVRGAIPGAPGGTSSSARRSPPSRSRKPQAEKPSKTTVAKKPKK